MDAVFVARERPTLEAFLDYHRDALVRKVSGVPDQDAHRRLVPSLTTLAGLLTHLRWVERYWFQHILLGRDDGAPSTTADPDADWRPGPDERLSDLVAAYQEACARSREACAGMSLDTIAALPRRGAPVSLRWILVHMIEETAQHNGHADILRELLDGATEL